MNIFLDIETIPEQPEEEAKAKISETIQAPATMSKPETIYAWHEGHGKYQGVKEAAIDAEYRKSSFDGANGEICSIGWATLDSDIFHFTRSKNQDESYLLQYFFDTLRNILGPHKTLDNSDQKTIYSFSPPYFIGHNIGGFDLKFLLQRCIINNIRPPFALPFSGRHSVDFYDTMIAWSGYKNWISQDNLCKALGIAGKPDNLDGSKVYDLWKDGDYKTIASYNMDDVEKNRLIYNRLNFL